MTPRPAVNTVDDAAELLDLLGKRKVDYAWAHLEADAVIAEFVRMLGYPAIADKFKRICERDRT